MQHYRYPGIRPFIVDEKNIFFGRDEDIQNLSQLISIESLVVLYGKSGLGKTSLLNAGLMPNLIAEESYETMIVRFGAYLSENSISPFENFERLVQSGLNESNFIHNKLIAKENISESNLWYLFKEKQLNQKESAAFIVVFDQFEDLFTYPENQITEFKKYLAELINVSIPQQLRNVLREKLLADNNYLSKEEALLLYQSINLKIVFSIRSDKLNLLNRLTDYLPNILKKCYELQPLTEQQATRAIVKPAQLADWNYFTKPFFFTDESLREIIRFLTKDGKQSIETFLLQMVCLHVETIVEKNKIDTITRDELGDLQNVSKNFYDNVISSLDAKDQLTARIFIEEGLIFEEDQRRLSMYEGQITKSYVSVAVLKKLLDSHLLRSEQFHTGGFSYELCHDILVQPILKSKALRLNAQKEKEELERIEILKKEAKVTARKKTMQVLLVASGIAAILLTVLIITSINSKIRARDQAQIIQHNDSIMTLISNFSVHLTTRIVEDGKNDVDAQVTIDSLNIILGNSPISKYYSEPFDKGATQGLRPISIDSALRVVGYTKDSIQYKAFLTGFMHQKKIDSLDKINSSVKK